jgi:hypothetical protein
MADIKLNGPLNLTGPLNLKDKVFVGGVEALVEGASGTAPGPVMIPPPPTGPADVSTSVRVVKSFNAMVTADGKAIVTLGFVTQGMWPGMVLPSSANTSPVSINHVAINVKDDSAIIFPSGASVGLSTSGQ